MKPATFNAPTPSTLNRQEPLHRWRMEVGSGGFRHEGDSFDAMPLDDGLPKQDSLRGLASVDGKRISPIWNMCLFRNAIALRLICLIRPILSPTETKSPFKTPLAGIAMISIMAGGLYIATRGLTD